MSRVLDAMLAGAHGSPMLPTPASSRSFAPPPPPEWGRLIRDAIREGTAATLAAGIIAGSGRTHTPVEAVAVMREVQAVLHPSWAPDASDRAPPT